MWSDQVNKKINIRARNKYQSAWTTLSRFRGTSYSVLRKIVQCNYHKNGGFVRKSSGVWIYY